MDKLEYRAVIKFLVKKGLKAREIFMELQSVYGESAPSERTVERWSVEFRRGRESLEDDPRTGAPSTSTNEDTVATVELMVMEDRHITVREVAETLGMHLCRFCVLHPAGPAQHEEVQCQVGAADPHSRDEGQSRCLFQGAAAAGRGSCCELL